MEKIDFKKKYQNLYKPLVKKVEIVDVPQMNFLMVDGKGDPNTSKSFSDAIESLFSLAYTLKFMAKNGEISIDYSVLPLEALWWADDMSSFAEGNKDDWKWTVMIMQPEFITKEMVDIAIKKMELKKNLVSLPLVRFEPFKEGEAAQTMHIGPFSEEGPTIEKVHSFIKEKGRQRVGKHHEIYLSDIRRADPEKWKTIIRQPMLSHMIFFILTKDGFMQMEQVIRSQRSPVWVNNGLFSESELSSLRSSGMEITNFTFRISPYDPEKIVDAVFTIEEHHPGERIWVEIIAKT